MLQETKEREFLVQGKANGGAKGGQLSSCNGTTVLLHTEDGVEKIAIRSETGQVIFEYQPETKKCWFTVPRGDLNFSAPEGSISFSAGKDIRLKCPGEIVIDADSTLHLRSGEQFQKESSLHLNGEGAGLRGENIAIIGQKGSVALDSTTIRGRRLAAKFERSRFVLDDLEVIAGTVRQKSRNVVQQVENLLQVNAGRVRTFVKGLYHLKGKRTYLKADNDMKLKADKIHLR